MSQKRWYGYSLYLKMYGSEYVFNLKIKVGYFNLDLWTKISTIRLDEKSRTNKQDQELWADTRGLKNMESHPHVTANELKL